MSKKSIAHAVYALEEKLAAIGVMAASRRLSPEEMDEIDIEESIVHAVVEFVVDGASQRYLGPLLAWVQEHGSAVIVEKLVRLLRERAQKKEDVAFAALLAHAAVREGHKRWSALFSFSPGPPRLVGASDIAPSLLKLRGREEWASEAGFLVPLGSLKIEKKWSLSREALARLNRQYRNRLIYGAQWRADIISAIERGAKTPSEASRISGASYEPCHRVFSELSAAAFLLSANLSRSRRST